MLSSCRWGTVGVSDVASGEVFRSGPRVLGFGLAGAD